MKRKWVYLALPLVLAALMLGVKWRAEHPTPTKEALRIRALMLTASRVEIVYSKNYKEFHETLYERELKPFVDSFYLSNQTMRSSLQPVGAIGIYKLQFDFFKPREDSVVGLTSNIQMDSREGNVFVSSPQKDTAYKLHPTTVKRWMELFLNHPHIGLELRARLK